MPTLVIDGRSIDVAVEKRLVLAIKSMDIDIGHRCGGKARCTTCRVEFLSGEPERMTRAEFEKLSERGLLGRYRLSCQLTCSQDMQVVVGMTQASEGWPDTGPPPDEQVQPEATWFLREELEGG
ncbi:MAG: 2Fe-2S iron-sulfur cluster-binding protein [Truepera sp.]|nr:2Fe-2S iron-sulfur cluster-binding protein [Truepera sp.]